MNEPSNALHVMDPGDTRSFGSHVHLVQHRSSQRHDLATELCDALAIIEDHLGAFGDEPAARRELGLIRAELAGRSPEVKRIQDSFVGLGRIAQAGTHATDAGCGLLDAIARGMNLVDRLWP